MKPSKKRHHIEDSELDDHRRVPITALAELTSSEVVAQLKLGMSRITPLDDDEKFDEPPPY